MKAVVFEKLGGPLISTEMPDPIPQMGQVVIKIHAASVNPADHKVREGHSIIMPSNKTDFPLPHISGRDFSGVVCQLAPDVEDFQIGDAVFGVLTAGQEGTYAEKVSENADILTKKPETMTHPEAAALALTGLTALVSLEDTGKLLAEEKVLIQGGAGGVGSFAVQLARHIGAKVISTASAENHDYVQKLGAHEMIDYNSTDFREVISECDLVYDTVGGLVHQNSYEVLKPGGRMVYVAPQPENFVVPRNDVEVLRPQVIRKRVYLERIVDLFSSGEIIPPEIEVLPLAEAAAAQEKSKSGHVRGKIVLNPQL